MTRLSTQHALPPTPRSVVLAELAVAAGIAGQSVTLLYQDYAGPALCEIWKYLMQGLALNEVAHVRTQADVRHLAEHVADPRLVLVHAPRLHDAVAWSIQMVQTAQVEIVPQPAVLIRGVSSELDTDPGATLVLRCDPQETAAITQWSILAGQAGPGWEDFQTPANMQMHPALVPLLAFDSSPRAGGVRCIRDRQVLRSLLIGAGLRRSSRQDSCTGETVDVNLQDYELIRRVLQSRLVATPDVPVDRMAVDMINRVNVYLDVMYGPDQTTENPFQADEYYESDRAMAERRGRPLVTRREIADLGNTHSGTVRRLIEHLQRRRDGYELFRTMGLARRPPGPGDWTGFPASRLAGLLRPWTEKQTRTHFERLQKAGLITAERQPSNGPWRYLLPEEFSAAGAAFRDMPPVDELPPLASAHAVGVVD